MYVKSFISFPKVSMKDLFVALVYFTIFLYAITPSAAKNPDGFLSIDCGNIEGQYTDAQTSLTWESDSSYIQFGRNGNISSSIPSNLTNYEALKTFRYFPPGLPKYCYELPTPNENTPFLIRAMFLHGESPDLDRRIRFQVYINATNWLQVQYGFDNEYDGFDNEDDLVLTEPKVEEGIFLNHEGEKVHVCFVPEIGSPFISSLELRRLDSNMYSGAFLDGSRWGYGDFFLSNTIRLNAGQQNAPLVRYPYDTYDRFWENSDNLSNIMGVSAYDGNFQDINMSGISLQRFNSLPFEVMGDAWFIGQNGVYITLLSTGNFLTVYSLAYLTLYVYSNETTLQFSPLPLSLALDESTQIFNISDQISVISIPFSVNQNTTTIQLGGVPPDRTLCLMALEVYRQDRFDTAQTGDHDRNVLQYLKQTFNMSESYAWQGDPCTPTPYDGITCHHDDTYGDPGIWYIESLTLSYLENSNRLMTSPTGDYSLLIRNL